jgi:hypothetical protein
MASPTAFSSRSPSPQRAAGDRAFKSTSELRCHTRSDSASGFSLRMSLNQRVPGSSPGWPTTQSAVFALYGDRRERPAIGGVFCLRSDRSRSPFAEMRQFRRQSPVAKFPFLARFRFPSESTGATCWRSPTSQSGPCNAVLVGLGDGVFATGGQHRPPMEQADVRAQDPPHPFEPVVAWAFDLAQASGLRPRHLGRRMRGMRKANSARCQLWLTTS